MAWFCFLGFFCGEFGLFVSMKLSDYNGVVLYIIVSHSLVRLIPHNELGRIRVFTRANHLRIAMKWIQHIE